MRDDSTHREAPAAAPKPDAAARGTRNDDSQYRLLDLLGKGGMGVVYRAEDLRLGRLVALKYLSSARMATPRARAQFLNEARAAAALDHPNLCTIYEAGETPSGELYIAMACYDGETLKGRLECGPLPAAEAIRIAAQVARGLAKAHRQGIVHRDVKPANLMLTADGIVKILDFGIAHQPDETVCDPPCPAPPGTTAYMSPEQARGAKVDGRSDLWSLGVVLHEMLAGRRPRAGRAPEVPPRLGRLLSRLLAPDPADRYADADALLSDLEGLERSGPRPKAALWLAMVLGAALAASSLLLGGAARQAPDREPAAKLFTRLTDLPGREWFPSLSPDGTYFAYVKSVGLRDHIFLQRVEGGNALDLSRDSPADDTQPAFSPDGRAIAFRSERDGGGIFLMGATGESVRRLTDFGFNPAWSPDGREILCATEGIVDPRRRRQPSRIYRVSVATGERRLVTSADAVQPSWSPHGNRIAYWGVSSGRRIISTVSAAGSGEVPVTSEPSLDWNPVWSPDGRFLYFASDRSGAMNLWRVRLDESSGQVRGKPEPMTAPCEASAQISISKSGRQLLFASDQSRSTVEKAAFDPEREALAGALTTIVSTSRMIASCDASRDGRFLALQTAVPQETIRIVDTDGREIRQLAGEGFRNRLPRWSPDGSRLAFYSNRGGSYQIWTVAADGSHLAPASAVAGTLIGHPVWSPDGTRLACDLDRNEALLDLGRPLAARQPHVLPPAGPGLGFSASAWSADGRWLAGILHRTDGFREPGVVLYSLAEQRYVRLGSRGDSPCWLADSRRLIFLDSREIDLLDSRGPRAVTLLTAPAGSVYNDVTLSPDGRTLYLVRLAQEGDIWLLTMS